MLTAAKPSSRLRSVLLVEDDDDSALLMEFAWKEASVRHPLVHVRDGREAVTLLEAGLRSKARSQKVGLILLDIKMPELDGFETLKWIKSRPALVKIPIIILSSSSLQRDVGRSKTLGAAAYFVKPGTFQELVSVVKTLETKWLKRRRA